MMKDEKAYTVYMSTSPESFTAEIMESQQNMDLLNRLLLIIGCSHAYNEDNKNYFYMHIHFIGIGGIGTSALAKFYLNSGATVSGSDLAASEITAELARVGLLITIGAHRGEHIPQETDLVVYTAAVPHNNPELIEARRRGIKRKTYAQALGPITKQYKTITISGAHGKSTTTALIALVLEHGYFDPLVIVGTKLAEFGDSNFRAGRSGYFVLEADEYDRSFLQYSPYIAVVTNIDHEHLDTYKTIEGVEQAFAKYLSKIPQGGTIVANADDARVCRIVERIADRRVAWYSLNDSESQLIKKVLKIPGAHNVSNALAALHVGRLLGIQEPDILYALSSFRGAWRRFQLKGTFRGATVISDYGHHPQEIHATIHAARERFPWRRIWCIFQPHHYERLHALWDEFASAFDFADCVMLLPVYEVAGRERRKKQMQQKDSQQLAAAIKERKNDVHYCATFDSAKQILDNEVRRGDVLLLMGAGDIDSLSVELVEHCAE